MRFSIKSVTMDDIAKTLSMSKKTIYQFFGDKDELVSEMMNKLLESEQAEVEKIYRESENSIEELHRFSNFLREHVVNINPALLYDLKKYHHSSWMTFKHYKKTVFLNTLISSLKRGMKDGYYRKDLNPEILAKLRMEEIEMTFDPEIFEREKFEFKEVHLQLFDHFVNGIITEKGRTLLNEYYPEKVNPNEL